MKQVFPRSANVFAPISIVVFVLLAGIGSALLLFSPEASFSTAREQPIAFSHQQHIVELGIDCRYCHTTVETSAFAGIPSTQVCMNCHSEVKTSSTLLALLHESADTGTPLNWTRVDYLPDFAYFDHSAHVTKGVACVTCHGQVDQMTVAVQVKSFQMSWCMDCHRNPAPNIRPRDQVFNMNWQQPENFDEIRQSLMKQYHIESKTDCSTCHR